MHRFSHYLLPKPFSSLKRKKSNKVDLDLFVIKIKIWSIPPITTTSKNTKTHTSICPPWKANIKTTRRKPNPLPLTLSIPSIKWSSRFAGISISILLWRKITKIGIWNGSMELSALILSANYNRIRKSIISLGWTHFPERTIWLKIWIKCKLLSLNSTISSPKPSYFPTTFPSSNHTTTSRDAEARRKHS